MRFVRIYGLVIVLLGLSTLFLMSTNVNAADARNFNAGRIIDDGVFTNSSSMTVDQIQSFLNSKVTCDTYGQKRSELGGGTRAQWMNARGIYAPFRCVTDYRENPATGQNNYGKNDAPAGSISAAEIIYNYSRQFNINPQVIIATLQKENGMITDEWPTPKQFSEAMGFGCPDNVAPGAPACDPQYGSFSAQIYQAARHFRGYMDNKPGWYVPFNTGWNSISFSPTSSCGRGDVFIENRATVALYSYTPYQPNQAAKNAQYGTGDGCSAYGNRNFYLYFTDWFGSVYGDVQIISPVTLLSSVPGGGLYANSFVEASFVLRNNSAQTKDVGSISIAVRDANGRNFDFGTERIVLAPYQEYLYRKATNLVAESNYTLFVTTYRNGVWDDNYPSIIGGYPRRFDNKLVQALPTITADPAGDSEFRVGKTSNVAFSVKNNSAYPINLGSIGLGVRSPSGKNADLSGERISNLAAGSTYTFSKQFTPAEIGEYQSTIVSTLDNGLTWNNATFPIPSGSNDGRSVLNVKPNPTLTQGPQLMSSVARVGDDSAFTFKIRNFGDKPSDIGYVGLAIRDPDNQNVDINGATLNALAPGSEYVFNGSRKFTKPGLYTAWVVLYKSGVWYDNQPLSESQAVMRKLTFTVKPNPTLTQGITMSPQTLRDGDQTTASFKVKNSSASTATVNKSQCLIVRTVQGTGNYDFGCMDISSLTAGQELVFNASRKLPAGTYKAFFSTYDGRYWYDNTSFDQETGNEPKTLTFTVKSSPSLTQGLTLSKSSPRVGETITGTFKVSNLSSAAVSVNKNICFIVRGDDSQNKDFGCMTINSLNPLQEQTFSASKVFDKPGTYKAFFSTYDGRYWYDNTSFDQETGNEPKTLTFTVSQ